MLAVHWQMDTWKKMIDAYVVTTEFYRRKFIEAGFPPEKLMLKPHFVEDPGVVHRDGGYAVFIGRLSPEKGVPTLLRAVQGLSNIPIKFEEKARCCRKSRKSPGNPGERWKLCHVSTGQS